LIDRKSTIEDVVREYPDAVRIFMRYGIKAIVCGDPLWGTIENEAKRQGLSDEKIDELLEELRKLEGKKFLKLEDV